MSEFKVRCITIDCVEEHSNADSLEITYVDSGYPVVIAKGSFKVGDLAIYIPIDSIVDCTRPEFSFLAQADLSTDDKAKGKTRATYRIKAKKLRGVFSMGLLIPWLDSYDTEIMSWQEILGIEKWEPKLQVSFSGNQGTGPSLGYSAKYTDIEGYRAFTEVFEEGDAVTISEKIHGCNSRFLYKDRELHVGSHRCWWKEEEGNVYWRAAKQLNLEDRLKSYEGIILYGEIYGVQDLKYGLKNGEIKLRFFDAAVDGTYMNWNDFVNFVAKLFSVDTSEVSEYIVPVLYTGEWHKDLVELAEGFSVMPNSGTQIREGVVIKPVNEQYDRALGGRKILKLVGQGYLLRKNA